MNNGVENIGKKDVAWSYIATIFMVGSGVLLLPFILHEMSAETVGLWNIFIAITGLVNLLDFGFRPSFARNISYIFSGVTKLYKEGVQEASAENPIDFSLLKGTIKAMQKFYYRMSVVVFFGLLTIGTAYLYYILRNYSEDKTDAIIAWLLLIVINSYNLYTQYYDALLIGKGYVKRDQQITIISQATYLIIAIILILAGFSLTAIVSSKLISVIIRRYLSYKTFFTAELKSILKDASSEDANEILRVITPNAVKVGCTNLGSFLVNKSAVFFGSVCLTLEDIACYGITLHIIDLLSNCGSVVSRSYTPKLAQYRASKNVVGLQKIFVLCVEMMLLIYILGGFSIVLLGNWAMELIGSQTQLLPSQMIIVMLIFSCLECNHSMSSLFISADNRIPFFVPSLISGAFTVLLLWIFLFHFNFEVWGLVLANGIAQLVYQNWKWPSVVIKELYFNANTQNYECR